MGKPNKSDGSCHSVHGWIAIFNPTFVLLSPMAQSEGFVIHVTTGKETVSRRGGREVKEKRKRHNNE